ncbi:MAG: ribosome biogenesis GTPase Der [Desulfovibrio sp.]|jgi:GTP-binding protein|nr:ribosome biogenesis GTPase Der [Desulfovibrio sp.]
MTSRTPPSGGKQDRIGASPASGNTLRIPLSGENAPLVALLGRPNVGKSTLFNRLIRSRRAITHDLPGITRDRMEGTVKRRGERTFLLVDTGGVTPDGGRAVSDAPEGLRGFEGEVLAQAEVAVRDADLLCLVADARAGLTPQDERLAAFLRRTGKDILLVLNKVDGPENEDALAAEFYSLGLPVVCCSAAHGHNVRELEDELRRRLFPAHDRESAPSATSAAAVTSAPFPGPLPATPVDGFRPDADCADPSVPGDMRDAATTERPGDVGEGAGADVAFPQPVYAAGQREDADGDSGADAAPLRLALLGRPNVGKSSLVNALLGEARMIVSEKEGTTRDSVDVRARINGTDIVFVDTAGVRQPARVTDTVERYSVNSSLKSSSKAQVTLLVLDAAQGLTRQDKRLVELLNERKTPFMLLANKTDLFKGEARRDSEKELQDALAFIPHVPLLFISAATGRNLDKIVPLALELRRECSLRIGTGLLNRAMAQVLERQRPPGVKGGRAKFFYLTQAEKDPPTFVFFVNDAALVRPAYARSLEKSLRALFGIRHAPMRVNFRSSHARKNGN